MISFFDSSWWRLVMGKATTFKAKYLDDGHLSIPKDVVASLSLRKGEEVQVNIEKERFDKMRFLRLFGTWRDKSEEEVRLYREIVKEREMFGRGEIKL
jgi:hypothetical protein